MQHRYTVVMGLMNTDADDPVFYSEESVMAEDDHQAIEKAYLRAHVLKVVEANKPDRLRNCSDFEIVVVLVMNNATKQIAFQSRFSS